MITCKQASQIVSQSLDKPLSRSDHIKLKIHLIICKACTRFSQQLRMLSDAVKRIGRDTESDNTIQLPIEAKIRILNTIETQDHTQQ